MFYDNHTHTTFSPDARTTVKDSISFARNAGMSGIAFTDHLDLDAPARDCEFMFDINLQQKEIDNTCASFADNLGIEVLKGIEIGLQTDSLQKIKEYVSGHKFDVVIGSVHFVEHLDPFLQTYYQGKDYKRAYEGALGAIYTTAIAYKDFDILGHYDYITRYHDYPCRTITLKEFGNYIEPLLKFLADNGKALEINTNTFRERFNGTPQIDLNILKRFRELGGQAISLGSDAHDAVRIGENFEYYSQIIKECGFQYLVYYKNRKPHFYSI